MLPSTPAIPWTEPDPVTVPDALAQAVGGHPLVAATLARRGILTPAAAAGFLDPDHYTPCRPGDLPGVTTAVERIMAAVADREPIGVWGDFDVDGVTAATVMAEGLAAAGAVTAWVHIPHREREGHGVHLPTLQALAGTGLGLLITCDTGITAHEAIEWAAARGLDVIVCDHHLPEQSLPPARAIVSPRFLPGGHPLAAIPGVGAAHLLAAACLEAAGAGSPDRWLDLVALGLVADVAEQPGDVRYLLQRGLAALRNTTRPGLLALLAKAGVQQANLNEEHIGFSLAPRLNALGRLADAQAAVELFTTPDADRARAIVDRMETLNAQRQLLCSQVTAGALEQLDRHPELLAAPALVLGHPAWPASVVGIVASRLVERFGKPAVVMNAPDGGTARGSARSVAGIDISAAIRGVIEEKPGLLLSFGGHPMAAGLSLPAERLAEFRGALGRRAAEQAAIAPPAPPVQVDACLGWEEPSLELAQEMNRLAPFGAGNPALCFVSRGLRVAGSSDMGRTGEHRRATLVDQQGFERKVLWWHGADSPVPQGLIDLAYSLRINTFRGAAEAQVEWLDSRPTATPEITVPVGAGLPALVDHRAHVHPLEALRALTQAQPGLLVWAEGVRPPGVAAVTRRQLAQAPALAVWTAPPGSPEWLAAIAQVRPTVIHLFGQAAAPDDTGDFLKTLAGLVRHALAAKGGRAEYAALAAATGQTEQTVRLGLTWLAAAGQVRWLGEDLSAMDLAPADPAAPPPADLDKAAIQQRLTALLQETSAYRTFWRHADLAGDLR